MKLNRTHIFIAISSIALLVVLIMQVNWIFQTAKIKEKMFNEKADLVLARTTDALLSDQETCTKIEASPENMGPSGHVAVLEKNEIHKIDSLLIRSMKFYGFHVDYSFEVIKSEPPGMNGLNLINNSHSDQPACGQIGLEEEVNKNGFELKLYFPTKRQFILAEMGPMFITSVILILVVFVLFWRTVRSLIKEKKMSEYTADFLNNMTHEFKTPLTNIALAGKMIIKDPNIQDGDKIKHYSEIILEENEKLKLQVEQMLSMTAFEKGEIPLRKTELDFHELIHEAVKSIGIQIEHKQGNISFDLMAENVVVMGDKTHLVHALSNLLDNAIKYAREKPEISVQTSNVGENLMIVVRDNGVGIEKEYQKKVFDKFFRVPTGDIHDVKGFGLGLPYTKKVVELHGGTIELQSEKGKGSTFKIILPYV